jgi:hypothetical protein
MRAAKNDSSFTAWFIGGICCTLFIAIVAIVGLILGAVALSRIHNDRKNDAAESFRHVFCVDVHDRSAADLSTALLGKVVINTKENTLCLRGSFFRETGSCDTLESIVVKGPVNEAELLDPVHVIGVLYNQSNNATSGNLSSCIHLSPSQARRLLVNPALCYIEANFAGVSCGDNLYRDYFTGICADADFRVGRDVDDDDTADDDDVVDYDASYVSSEASDDSELGDTSEEDLLSSSSSSDDLDDTSEEDPSDSSSSVITRRATVSHHKSSRAAKAHAAANARHNRH